MDTSGFYSARIGNRTTLLQSMDSYTDDKSICIHSFTRQTIYLCIKQLTCFPKFG